MRRDATASKCFVQLVGNRKLVGDMALEQPSLPASEFVSFQNYVGLRGWTRTGRPYPAFRGMCESSTCGFDFTDCAMLGGSRPGPVNRHGFGIVGYAGARLAPIMGPAPAGQPLGGWRTTPRMRETAVRGIRDVPRAPERRAAATPPPAGRALGSVPHPRPGCAPAPTSAESFSEIVLASPSEFPYSTSSHGGVAQLGERLTGSQEVRGSIPLVSTRALNEAPTQVGAFFHIGTQGQRRHHDPPGRQDRALNGCRVHGSISRRGSKRWKLFFRPNRDSYFIRALGATVSAGDS